MNKRAARAQTPTLNPVGFDADASQRKMRQLAAVYDNAPACDLAKAVCGSTSQQIAVVTAAAAAPETRSDCAATEAALERLRKRGLGHFQASAQGDVMTQSAALNQWMRQ